MADPRIDPLLDPTVDNDPLVASLSEPSGKGWGWVVAYGALLLVVALVALLDPLSAGVATGVLLGILLCLYGIAAIAAGATALSSRARWLEIGLGVLALLASIFAFVDPVAGALSLVWAMGVWLLVAGGFQVALAWRARHDRGWRLLLGALDIVLGFALMFAGPLAGLAFLAMIIAISLAVRGTFLVQLGLTLRKRAER